MAPLVVVAGSDALGEAVKNAAVEYLKTKEGVHVVDLGTDAYYTVAEKLARRVAGIEKITGDDAGTIKLEENPEIRGLVACGSGAGVTLISNRFRGVSAVFCDSPEAATNARSVNNCNVLALSGARTKPDEVAPMVDAWLSTEFRSPCPASGGQPWTEEVASFLEKSMPDIANICDPRPPVSNVAETPPICDLASDRAFVTVDGRPGASWKLIRKNPTTSVYRFKEGCIEPLHYHTHSYDLFVLSGHMLLQNVSSNQSFELRAGDFLLTPAGQLHRAYYYEDTEFFIKFEGPMDVIRKEDDGAARKALAEICKIKDV